LGSPEQVFHDLSYLFSYGTGDDFCTALGTHISRYIVHICGKVAAFKMHNNALEFERRVTLWAKS